MLFKLFIPYQGSMLDSNEMEGYYATEEDYVAALKAEEAANGSVIFNAMASGRFDITSQYQSNQHKAHTVQENIEYAKTDCTLYSPNGLTLEDVDSMIDKFASQREFLVTVQFNMTSMEGEFEEEFRAWNNETVTILRHGQQMGKEWVDKNIPKRNLRLSFLNKSNKEVNFTLENSEIEEKVSPNRYLLYVQRMQIIKKEN